jgi:hypothetical protein
MTNVWSRIQNFFGCTKQSLEEVFVPLPDVKEEIVVPERESVFEPISVPDSEPTSGPEPLQLFYDETPSLEYESDIEPEKIYYASDEDEYDDYYRD